MKRFGLVLFVALLFAGAASAVTVNWSAALKGNETYGGWMGVAIVAGNITEAKAYNDILGVSGSTATWKGENGIGFVQMVDISEGLRYPMLFSGNDKTYGALWGNNGVSERKVYQGNLALGDPTKGFALVLFNDWNKSYAVYNYQLWESVLGEDTLNLDFGDIGWTGGGTLTIHDTVAIPEPTALALLAFGVAGLVLRRRVI